MKASLDRFTRGLIDYAGLFPPAGLGLTDAIENYISYREVPESGILGSFVIPAGQLHALCTTEYKTEFQRSAGAYGPLGFSVLAGGGEQLPDCRAGIEQALEKINKFQSFFGDSITITALEIKLPASNDSKAALRDFLKHIRAITLKEDGSGPDLFFEPVRDIHWETRTERFCSAVTACGFAIKDGANSNKNGTSAGTKAKTGLKLRCGGIEAHMFPTIEQLAFGLHQAVMNGVSCKATAGLHHPVRHFNESNGCMMHGFLNVFGAVILGNKYGWMASDFEAMLRDESAAFFTFSDTDFEWNGCTADLNDIDFARNYLAGSYGSCSFVEPLEDLQELGLLRVSGELASSPGVGEHS
ncbi:MAG: hypothetical protein LAT67_13155 [Balneolales bacterium]|nr:hypothetical protein [Balneolales bacterium]